MHSFRNVAVLVFTIYMCMLAYGSRNSQLYCSVDRSGSKTAEQSGGVRKDHLLHWKLKTVHSEESLSVTDV